MIKKLLTILTAAVILTSCFKKEDFNLDMLAGEQDIDYDIAAPLFETKYTVDDLLFQLQSANVTTDEEGLVHFVFPDLSSVNFWDGINVVLPSGQTSLEISPIPYSQYDTTVSYSHSDTMDFYVKDQNGGDMFIDSVIFTDFNMNCDIESGVEAEIKVKIVFPTLIDRSTNLPATTEVTLANKGSNNQQITLTNVRWDAASNRNNQNQYRVPIVTTLTINLKTATASALDGYLQANVSFNAFDYNRLYGNIGTQKHIFKTAIPTSALLQLPTEELTLYEFLLKATISIKNLSIPVRLQSNRIVAIAKNGDTIIEFDPPIFPEPYYILSPLPTDIPFEKTTAYSKDVFEEITVNEVAEVFCEFVVEVNPDDGLLPVQNVLEKNAEISLDFDVDIPMHLSMTNYHLSDTMDFNMLTPEQIDKIHFFDLKMILTNAFPIDADIKVFFLDANYDTALTVYNARLEGGEVGADLHVVQPVVSNVEIRLLAAEEMEKLKKAKYISFIATFDTKNNEETKIFAGSEKEGYISLKAGLRAKLKAGSFIEDFLGGGGDDKSGTNPSEEPSSLRTSPSSLQTSPSSLQTSPSSLRASPSSLQTSPSSLQTSPSSLRARPAISSPPSLASPTVSAKSTIKSNSK